MSLKSFVLNNTPKEWHEPLANVWSRRRRAWLKERNRIGALPRYQAGESEILDKTIRFPDSASFLSMYEEIFLTEVYKFDSSSQRPYILDCGANIGLSVLYFKRLFPDAEIVAFEADPGIHDFLTKNLESFFIKGVECLNAAVWITDGELFFSSEGADAGRLTEEQKADAIKVPCVRLRDFISRPIDLLKVDIEGAEVEVLTDCQDRLELVSNLFVEYHSTTSRQQELDSLLRVLTKSGFRYYIEPVGIKSQFPFLDIKVHGEFDLQLNIFCYRPG